MDIIRIRKVPEGEIKELGKRKVGRLGSNVTCFVEKLSIERIESIKVDEKTKVKRIPTFINLLYFFIFPTKRLFTTYL